MAKSMGFLSQSPEELLATLQQQQKALDEHRRQQRASNPMTHAASSLGNLLGKGIGNMLGMGSSPTDNPLYQKAKAIQDITTSVPQDNPEQYYSEVGKKLLDAGYSNEAQMALNKLTEYKAAQAEATRKNREVAVKEKNANTNAAEHFRKKKWNQDYLDYLYKQLAQTKAKGAGKQKITGLELATWEGMADKVSRKDWAKGHKDPNSDWYGMSYKEFKNLDPIDKIHMMGSDSLETLNGFVQNNKIMERLMQRMGILTPDQAASQQSTATDKPPEDKFGLLDIPSN